jgi:hypothetical protein
MSAWRLGVESVAEGHEPAGEAGGGAVDLSARLTQASTPPVGGLDSLTKWIPGEVIVLYAAAVTAFGAETHAEPSIALLIVAGVLTPVIVVLFAYSRGTVKRKTWLTALFAAIAFAIWSLSVPFSGWQSWDLVQDNQLAVALVAAVSALLFGLLAEGLIRHYGGKT